MPPGSKSYVLAVFTVADLRLIKWKLLTSGSEQVLVARGVANIILLVPFYKFVKSFATKPVRLLEKMVIERAMETPTVRVQPSGPSKPTNREGEVNAVYKPSKAKTSQMKNHEEEKKPMTRKYSNKTVLTKSVL